MFPFLLPPAHASVAQLKTIVLQGSVILCNSLFESLEVRRLPGLKSEIFRLRSVQALGRPALWRVRCGPRAACCLQLPFGLLPATEGYWRLGSDRPAMQPFVCVLAAFTGPQPRGTGGTLMWVWTSRRDRGHPPEWPMRSSKARRGAERPTATLRPLTSDRCSLVTDRCFFETKKHPRRNSSLRRRL